MSTDVAALRGFDGNTLLRLYDDTKKARGTERTRHGRVRSARPLDKVGPVLWRRGVRV